MTGLTAHPATWWLGAGGLFLIIIVVAAISDRRQSAPSIPSTRSVAPGSAPIPPSAHRTLPATRAGFLGVSASTQAPIESETSPLKVPGGARLERIFDGGPAEKAGLRIRDLIYSVNGRSVSTHQELAETVAAAGAGSRVTVRVYREEGFRTLEVTLGERPN
ncbi:MAG: S1C family serine protease [Hyphomicrobiaceae bacterium]